MWQVPNMISFTKGTAEGHSHLNAFDNALLAGGIGNLNLVKVTSIVPPKARVEAIPSIPVGAVVPTVYAHITSNVSGEIISACVGMGLSSDSQGVIMEYAHPGSATVAEEIVKKMLKEALEKRNLSLTKTILISAEHKVKKLGCAVAAAILWWG
ncbi:MAG: arginine decarboxylase, pyruvoyl-dependent [Actinomycetota bacterium]|nr:arginine decarboxylase, pyruvoyl-dependent [Actinomycetota bacterium]